MNTNDNAYFLEAGEAVTGTLLSTGDTLTVQMPDGSSRSKEPDEVFASADELVNAMGDAFAQRVQQDTGLEVVVTIKE